MRGDASMAEPTRDTAVAEAAPPEPAEAAAARDADPPLVETELLVEEVSIDGMCGVY
jgi:mycofactocin precursor